MNKGNLKADTALWLAQKFTSLLLEIASVSYSSVLCKIWNRIINLGQRPPILTPIRNGLYFDCQGIPLKKKCKGNKWIYAATRSGRGSLFKGRLIVEMYACGYYDIDEPYM